MKIGIISFHYANNYGAVLQCYAFMKYLTSLGHSVYFIDYIPKDANKIAQNKLLSYRSLLLTSPFRFVQKALNSISSRVQKKISSMREVEFQDKFDDFRDKYFPMTKKYYSLDSLQHDPPDMDVYIAGSDQVWGGMNRAYYLKFGTQSVTKLAYAASFGKTKLSSEHANSLCDLLKNFDAISVREPSGKKIIENLTDYKVEQCVDPTLLIDNYDDICSYELVKKIKEPYLLIYRLRQSPSLDIKMTKIAKNIAHKNKLKIITVSTNNIIKKLEVGEQITPSPAEFIGLIKESSFFITNSFHGVVFSVLHNRPFYCFPRSLKSYEQNNRMIEFLKQSSLLDRYYDNAMKSLYDDSQLFNINWDIAFDNLEKLRDTSRSYLRINLKEKGGKEI